MKILQVCEYYQYLGGTEQYILDLSKRLENSGHTIGVMYGIETKNTLKASSRGEYFLPAIVENKKLDKHTEKELEYIIKKENPDVIYVHNVTNCHIIEKLFALRPLVRFVHDHRLFCPKGDKLFFKGDGICGLKCGFNCLANAYLKRCLPRDPRKSLPLIRYSLNALALSSQMELVVASRYMKDCLVLNGCSPEKVSVVPYYVASDFWGGGSYGDYVLFAGRLIRHKGAHLAVKVINAVPGDIKLMIAGEGIYESEIRAVAATERCIFAGCLDKENLFRLYRGALALLVPSLWAEPFGIVGIEAMACERPVVAFNVGGIDEWLSDEINGFMVPRLDTAAMADKIKLLASDRELAARLGENGRRIYMSKFSFERHMELLLRVFNKAAEKYESHS